LESSVAYAPLEPEEKKVVKIFLIHKNSRRLLFSIPQVLNGLKPIKQLIVLDNASATFLKDNGSTNEFCNSSFKMIIAAGYTVEEYAKTAVDLESVSDVEDSSDELDCCDESYQASISGNISPGVGSCVLDTSHGDNNEEAPNADGAQTADTLTQNEGAFDVGDLRDLMKDIEKEDDELMKKFDDDYDEVNIFIHINASVYKFDLF
jgi:hypothetical protein